MSEVTYTTEEGNKTMTEACMTKEHTKLTGLHEMVNQMLHLQNDMNRKVNSEWVAAQYPYYRAAWIECGELVDHIGWKWWKQQELDLEQAQLEMVDIWHFGLSMYVMDHDGDVETATEEVTTLVNVAVATDLTRHTEPKLPDVIEVIETLAAKLLTGKRFSVYHFIQICNMLDLDLEELHRQYVGKNILNFFRQDNGYKDGTYIKRWGKQEDNGVLTEILDNAKDIDVADVPEFIRTCLTNAYAAVLDAEKMLVKTTTES